MLYKRCRFSTFYIFSIPKQYTNTWCLKMPSKNKLGKFWNEKARAQLLSSIVVALMVISAFTGLFLMSERASAATVISENFEDISDWTQGSTEGYADVTQSTYTVHGGTYSAHVGVDNAYMHRSVSVSASSLTIDFWAYRNSSTSVQTFVSIQDFAVGGTIASRFNIQASAGGNYQVSMNDNGGSFTAFESTTPFPIGRWVHLTFVADSGTGHLYNDTTEVVNFAYSTTTTFTHFYVGDTGTGSTNSNDFYVDDLVVYDTAEYPSSGPTPPGAPTGATATAYTKFDISLSGYDGNSRFNFSTFYTDDTTGDATWSNSTSYGSFNPL